MDSKNLETKVKLSFSNNELHSVPMDLISTSLNQTPVLIRQYQEVPENKYKKNMNYWSVNLFETQNADLSDLIIDLKTFLTNKRKEILELKNNLNLDSFLTFIIKLYNDVTPSLNLNHEIISICSDLNIEIKFDIYVFHNNS